MLPKLPFPKRKLAITPDQMFAIQSLYEPLLPLPPIGCHKIIASQLKMDEWRVHVGIGLIRAKMGLSRWNEEREDVSDEVKKQREEQAAAKVAQNIEEPVTVGSEPSEEVEETKKKTTRKSTKKAAEKTEIQEEAALDKSDNTEVEAEAVEEVKETKKKTTRKTKKSEE